MTKVPIDSRKIKVPIDYGEMTEKQMISLARRLVKEANAVAWRQFEVVEK